MSEALQRLQEVRYVERDSIAVKKPFTGLHARAICHATEELDKVRAAMLNLLGDAEIKVTQTEGVHGNPIRIIEASLESVEDIESLLRRLSKEDLETIIETLPSRIDDGCNIFLRMSKQAALEKIAKLGENGDVISIRIRIAAFPARPEVAAQVAHEFLLGIIRR